MATANSSSADQKARALEQCERDLDLAIERLVNLRLDASDGGADAHDHDAVHPAAAAAEEEEEEPRSVFVGAVHAPSSESSTDQRVERLMEAMASAESWGDARARAARFLEDLGLDASVSVAVRQNAVLKKAVRVQHRLCKGMEGAIRELQRQLAACQDRVRGLETDNYALSMYLRQSQPPQGGGGGGGGGGSIAGRFHPEVF